MEIQARQREERKEKGAGDRGEGREKEIVKVKRKMGEAVRR